MSLPFYLREKHKKTKYSVFQTIRFIIGGVWRQDRVLFFQFIGQALSQAGRPFVYIIFPKLLLDELTGACRPERLIGELALMFLIAAGLHGAEALLEAKTRARAYQFRTHFEREYARKCMETDFPNTENADFLNRSENAKKSLWRIEQLQHSIFLLVGSLLSLAGYLLLVTSLSPWMVVLVGGNVGVVYILTYIVDQYRYKKREQVAEADRRAEYLEETCNDFRYGKDIRIFGLTSWLEQRLKQAKDRQLELQTDFEYHGMRWGFLHAPNGLIESLGVYGYLIYSVLYKGMSIGSFTMYSAATFQFYGWMIGVINELVFVTRHSPYISDLREFLEQKDAPAPETPLPLPDGPYSLEFRDVSFCYPGANKAVYRHLSLSIPAGQKLAVVGHNGAGKTTLVKLLTRLYEPDEGVILLNGIDIRRFDRKAYQRLFSAVFQEIKLTAWSAAENVAADASPDREKAESCLRQAGVWEKIESLSKGIDNPLLRVLDEEGVELSGGEQQKVALARALYRGGEILVLDEPTAALDALAESQIYQNFNRMAGGHTALYISHRLASTSFCDRIALFENGELMECGTHDELIALHGRYADMFEVQARYYRDGEEAREDEEIVIA